jgi:hypothetical protein
MSRGRNLGYLSRDELRQKGEERDEAFLERYVGWENRLKEVANTVEVIIAKQRMGPIGVEKLSFNPELTRFTDLWGNPLTPKRIVCQPDRPQLDQEPQSEPCPAIAIHKNNWIYGVVQKSRKSDDAGG